MGAQSRMRASASLGINAAVGVQVHSEEKGSGIALHFADHIDSSLTWDFLPWLHTVTSLPIFLKVRLLCCFMQFYSYILTRSCDTSSVDQSCSSPLSWTLSSCRG